MIWEFGEHVAFILRPISRLASPIWKCRCEARRTWLNSQGERLWKWLLPDQHDNFRYAWKIVAINRLWKCTLSAEDVCQHLRLTSYRTSENTCKRWLDDLVRSGDLATIIIGNVKRYGLPANSDTPPVNV